MRRLGIADALTLAYYETDNRVLRDIASEFPRVRVVPVSPPAACPLAARRVPI